MAERPEDFYSKGAEEFAENNSLNNMPQVYIDLLDYFIENMPEKGRVLDAGCGHGRDTHYFARHGLEPVGVDLAEDMIDYAKENKEGEFHKMDINDLAFENQSFDGVWCNTVLIFFPPQEMKQILQELKRVLKEDGMLYLGLKAGQRDYVYREKYGSKVKQYLLTEKESMQMIQELGFKIERMEKTETQNNIKILNLFCKW